MRRSLAVWLSVAAGIVTAAVIRAMRARRQHTRDLDAGAVSEHWVAQHRGTWSDDT